MKINGTNYPGFDYDVRSNGFGCEWSVTRNGVALSSGAQTSSSYAVEDARAEIKRLAEHGDCDNPASIYYSPATPQLPRHYAGEAITA